MELEIDTISKKVLDHKFAEYILPDREFTRKGEYLGEFKLVERDNTRYVWEENYWTKITDEGNGKYSLIIISGFNHSVIKNIEFYENDSLEDIVKKVKAGKDTAEYMGKVAFALPILMDINPTLKFGKIAMRLRFLKEGIKQTTKIASKVDNLLDPKLIQELREKGIKFTKENLKFITKNTDGTIIFLEKGDKIKGGLEHIIHRHWNKEELIKYFSSEDHLIQALHNSISKNKYITKVIDKHNRLSFIYTIETLKGTKTILLGVGNNGFIVTLYMK